MKKFILLFIVIVLSLSAPVRTQNNCGTGILQRVDGGLIIDSFTIFVSAPTAPGIAGKQGPTSITLGKTLPDDLPICIETNSGSHCVSLKQVRGLK